MHKFEGKIRYSPSDLTRFLDSEFASWMDRWQLEQNNRAGAVAQHKAPPQSQNLPCQPDNTNEELALYADKGFQHERDFLGTLQSAGKKVIEITQSEASVQQTIAALRAGPEVIFQAHLAHDNFAGHADFLIRQPGTSSLGDYHYEVWDTKLARSPKPYFVVQLCMYADFLEQLQGKRPSSFVVVLGNREQVRFNTQDYFHYYCSLKQSFLDFQDKFDPNAPPHPSKFKSHGRWSEYAASILLAEDHLSQVANISRLQIMKLEESGIRTLNDLATTRKKHVSKLAPDTFEKLQRQARLQVQTTATEKPAFEVLAHDEATLHGLRLLPPASLNDVYFDMEGFPLHEGGLEYLFGAVILDDNNPLFCDWWAHDKRQEKKAFEDFIDWVHDRWQQDPSMHIYHYAAYEVKTIQRLMGNFATRESQVDDLLRNKVFVDLYAVVRQGLAIGTTSYSLKQVERLFMDDREGGVTTSGGSIVAYHKWIQSGESENWQESEILREIRDYNKVDCESTWRLAEWLRKVQTDAKLDFFQSGPVAESELKDVDQPLEKEHPNAKAAALAAAMLAQVPDSKDLTESDRVRQLLAWLLEFHWREAKPVFWRKFEFAKMSDSELIDEFDCLGGLRRTEKPKQPNKRSFLYEYRYNADQDTKLGVGASCLLAHDPRIRTTIETMDPDKELLEIKLGPSQPEPPATLNLIPDEFVSAKVMADAVYRYVEAWQKGNTLSTAVDDLLHRRIPRITDHAGGPLVQETSALLDATVDIIRRMNKTVLCIQGPPGTGKTYTASQAIVRLLQDGKKIAVTANGHKAILNVLRAIKLNLEKAGLDFDVVKIGGDPQETTQHHHGIRHVDGSKDTVAQLDGGPIVIGGTAWVFSRPELEQKFDYLFVDEAGQFSLANVIATGCCAKNIVLVGDQMQLSQPTLGTHPGESGKSALEYYLQGHQTIRPELGVLLNETYRMHPKICRFISDAFYESRLHSHPKTVKQKILFSTNQSDALIKEAGTVFLPIAHEGNRQASEEEAEMIERLVNKLVGQSFFDAQHDRTRPLLLDDVLVVAPFNMQVRMLRQRLGGQARVGTVDKFQGQEAPVVIVSMCASSLEEAPRGASFLLDPNRLNVAISRAQALAIVIASPALTVAKCQSIQEMKLANTFCWLVESAREQ